MGSERSIHRTTSQSQKKEIAMNRREFLSVMGGAAVLSTVNTSLALDGNITPLYVKGLVIFDMDDKKALKLAFPKAPGHKATLAIVPANGSSRTMTIKGHGSLEAKDLLASSADPRIFVPELVRMKEFYGASIKSRANAAPSVITIPYASIRSVTTSEVSSDRITFVRADNGKEVETFRPRRVAETIKIDLSSASVLKLDNGKVSIPLETARELRIDYAPETMTGFDGYRDHFQHFFSYVERPAALDFDVVPQKVGGNSAPTPRVGHHFAMVWPDPFCYPAGIP
jgi:hypothetical protein